MLLDYNLKAVVFDDRESEAKPLIDALNYERIPNIFINFGEDKRDDKKLSNIRIVFADLILGSSKSGAPEAIIEAVRGSILDNIDETNGPFILIVWSKDSDGLAEVLRRRLKEANPKMNFITLALDKNNYFEIKQDDIWGLKEGKTFENIHSDIVELVEGLDYLPIFLEWEKDARESISKILNNFLEDISDGTKVKETVSSTIKFTLGNKVEANTQDKIDAFYRTLNTVLADGIINNSNPLDKHDGFLSDLDLEDINDDMKAEINRKTLFEIPKDNELKTGNIYSFEDFKNMLYGDVIKDVCGCDDEGTFKKSIFRYTKKCKLFEKEIGESDPSYHKRHLDEMMRGSYPILLDFTPSCDIANKKYEKSRLIFGYMIDSKYKCIEPKSESLYTTSFHFRFKNKSKELNSNYRLVFLIKNIISINPEKVKQLDPLIRARKEFATDLQHAIANHISRIGISSLDTKWD